MMLAVESNNVIGLRLSKMALGGLSACDEAILMVREKVDAAMEASAAIATGETPAAIISRYREHVAANASRLSAG